MFLVPDSKSRLISSSFDLELLKNLTNIIP